MKLLTIPDPTGDVDVLYELAPVEKVSWLSKAAIDGDGSGDSHGDTCFQNDTSLHNNGNPLNSDVDRYIVVPPQVQQRTRGIVLGCIATVTHTKTGLQCAAVVGDIGPHHKIGEISCATAWALGLDPSPIHGGTDLHDIYYEIFPGQPAPGYTLQPA